MEEKGTTPNGLCTMKSPGDAIREELQSRGWTQVDLATVLNRPIPTVNEIIVGKRAIMPEMAAALGAAFGNGAEFWTRLEADYRLSQVKGDTTDVKRRARVYELGPVKEMVKRGWLPESDQVEDLEGDVARFFEINSLDESPSIHGAMRKSGPDLAASPPQRAWAFRVRQLAKAIPASALGSYDESTIETCKQELRRLAAYSAEVRKVPAVLAAYGIRFVVVEGLTSAKMDGFATWLDERSPVIGMSLKYDRLDNFWFTLGHELSHIKHHDLAPIDGSVGGQDELSLDVKPPMERRADEEGAETFIKREQLESFIRRVGPLYSMDRINQFANTIKIHPSIIVGQLKHRGEVGHTKFHKLNVLIREAVTKTAITDGFGKTFYEGALT